MAASQLIFGFYNTSTIKDGFKTGVLICTSPFGNLRFIATSGLKFYQGIGGCSRRGRGAIPPCKLVGIAKYTVTTKPIPMPGIKGVEGNFYQILPFEVLVDQYGKTVKRADFGVHADKNVKGTAGCIGILPGEHWRAFEDHMKKISTAGEKTIDLFVPMPDATTISF